MSNDSAVPPQADAARQAKEKRPTSNWAQIASAVIAAVALVVVGFQIQTIKTNNREAALQNRESAARQMFRSQLEIEMKNPKLVLQDYSKMSDANESEKLRYIDFVTHLLYTCEELMSTMPGDYGWRKTCALRLQNHAPYLCSPDFEQALDTYHPLVQDLVRSIRQEAGRSGVPACARFK